MRKFLTALFGLALVGGGLSVATSPVQAAASVTPARSYVSNGVPKVMEAGKAPKTAQSLKGMPGSTESSGVGARTACATPCYFYGGADMSPLAGTAQGVTANIHIVDTYLNSADYHTLGEIAAINDNTLPKASRNIVEIGSTVDPTICGAQPVPCMFSGYWKLGVFQGYNVGMVAYSPTCSVAANYCVGESLAAFNTGGVNGTAMRFRIEHSGGQWWVAANGLWVGAFPDTLWASSSFTSAKSLKAFYELAASTTTPCSDMGNGLLGSDASGWQARVGTINLVGDSPAVADNFVPYATAPYDAVAVTGATTRAGGPGYSSTGTLPGVRGGC